MVRDVIFASLENFKGVRCQYLNELCVYARHGVTYLPVEIDDVVPPIPTWLKVNSHRCPTPICSAGDWAGAVTIRPVPSRGGVLGNISDVVLLPVSRADYADLRVEHD